MPDADRGSGALRDATAPAGRIEIIDSLRGFALFGVLVMNMQYFVHPPYPAQLASPEASGLDWAAFWFVRLFAESKFYPLFSFLFGYGMALQMQRAAARSARFVPFFAWRLTLLLLIGAYHSVYIWSGDILATYAVLGFVLLAFRRAPDALLLALGVLFLFAVTLTQAVTLVLLDSGLLPPETGASIQSWFADVGDPDRRAARQALRAMSMFFFGFWGGRRQLFSEPPRRLPRAWTAAALGLGLAGNALYTLLRETVDPEVLSWAWVATIATLAVAGPLLAVGYVAGLLELAALPAWRRRLAWFAPVGRTALTNYLLQSVICIPLVGRRGLGQLGGADPVAGLALTFCVFALQLVLSHWWLRHFRFGPVEWLWRSLTYGRAQPMRARES